MIRALGSLLRIGLLSLDLAAVVVVVAWCVGRLCSDRYHWSQWLLWVPTAAAIAVSLIGLAAAARPGRRRGRRRRRMLTWLAVIAMLVVHLGLIEHRMLSRPGPEPPGLHVVHWNVTATRATPREALAARVVAQDADVTILTNPPPLLGITALREWAEGQVQRTRPPFTVITRLPMLRMRPLVASDGIQITLLELDAAEPLGRPLTLWLVDLPSDPRAPRRSVARSARRLLAAADAPVPDLIVGDFNMTRGAWSLEQLAPGFRNAYDLAGAGWGGTYHRRVPLYHIDHVLVGPGLTVLDYRVLDPGLGEHRLQRLTLTAETAETAE